MNILFTCAGRRNYLIDYFKEVKKVNNVIACNSILDTSAMIASDIAYIVPEVFDSNYIDVLLNICKKEKVNYLFSLHDLDGIILSKKKSLFQQIGTKVYISNYELMRDCLDKYEASKLLESFNFNTPATIKNIKEIDKIFDVNKKFIVKDRYGFGSNDIFVTEDLNEILFFYNYINRRYQSNDKIRKFLDIGYEESGAIVQEFIDGQEFGVNLINDFVGNYKGCLQIIKHSMRSGETDSASVINNDDIDKLSFDLANKTKHIGVLDCDLIYNSGRYYVIEMNPRFGGQYPFSHEAGSNVPSVLLGLENELVKGKENTKFYKELVIKKINTKPINN